MYQVTFHHQWDAAYSPSSVLEGKQTVTLLAGSQQRHISVCSSTILCVQFR